MNAKQVLAALIILVIVQVACGAEPATVEPPGPGVHTPVPVATTQKPPAAAPTIGAISNLLTRVRAGASSALRDIEGREELQNGDGVQVTEGGKARLEFPGPISVLVYNESEVEGVRAEVESSSNPRIAHRLIRGGLSGHVTPGSQLTIDLTFGRRVTVLGTDFFVVFNEDNGYTTVGKFNGTLILSIPGQGDVKLDSEMVDITPNGHTTYYTPIPFNVDQFEQAATNNSAVDGLNDLRRDFKLPPQGATSTPTPTPTRTPTPTPTITVTVPPDPYINTFNIFPNPITQGDCATISWSVYFARQVYLDKAEVGSSDSRSVCPKYNTSYTLNAVPLYGSSSGTVRSTVTLEVISAPSLTAPVQLAPDNGSVFSHVPRTTTLEWTSVPGAASYRVEIDCMLCCSMTQWCTDVGTTWQVETVYGTSFTWDWVGAQPGRWRVWAVDGNGVEGPKSGWWEFSFTQ